MVERYNIFANSKKKGKVIHKLGKEMRKAVQKRTYCDGTSGL
jgi:hypothetical protein